MYVARTVVPDTKIYYSLANHYRSSGAFQDWKRSSASVLPISFRARRSRSIECVRSPSARFFILCSASAKNSSSRFDVAHISMIPRSSSLLSFRAFAVRLFAFPLLHLSSPALALQFCLAFAFFDQARYVNGRLYQFAYDSGDSGREVSLLGFPPLLGPLGKRVGRIGLQTQSAGREIVCAGPASIRYITVTSFRDVTQAHIFTVDMALLYIT